MALSALYSPCPPRCSQETTRDQPKRQIDTTHHRLFMLISAHCLPFILPPSDTSCSLCRDFVSFVPLNRPQLPFPRRALKSSGRFPSRRVNPGLHERRQRPLRNFPLRRMGIRENVVLRQQAQRPFETEWLFSLPRLFVWGGKLRGGFFEDFYRTFIHR